jgi:hypothetical protein
VRQQTLNSYLYTQYADDDDLQALVEAYNQGTQYFVDWFNNVNLPYYPGLSGGLLNWVAEGLYGLQRTQLASQLSSAKGALNTVALNTMVLNGSIPASQTFYDLTDDIFKRILTWNLYKGDGRQFSVRWLKRRIIRFLVGTDGVDPNPADPGFTIGTETTSAVGVVISSGNIAVAIDQSALSLQAGVTPGVLQLFKAALEGGNLEMPLGYSIAVSIITGFVAIARPNVLTSDGPQFTQTTAATGVAVLGGTGNYSYVWAFRTAGLGGPAAIQSSAAGALTTAERLAGSAQVGTNATGELAGTPGGKAHIDSAASGTLSGPAHPALAGAAAVITGATATFDRGSQLVIDSPLSPNTTFTGRNLSWGQTLTGVAVCTVTDLVSGKTAQATVLVTITCSMPNQLLTEGSGIPIFIEGAPVSLVVEP